MTEAFIEDEPSRRGKGGRPRGGRRHMKKRPDIEQVIAFPGRCERECGCCTDFAVGQAHYRFQDGQTGTADVCAFHFEMAKINPSRFFAHQRTKPGFVKGPGYHAQ